MNLLVASADRVRAGKTTFSLGLVEYVGGVGFKPQAGNDVWHHHDQYQSTVSEGRLYGSDAAKLARASSAAVAPEDVNPVHRLWKPVPGRGTGLLGQEGRDFVVDRVGEEYVVNATVDLPALVREQLPVDDATTVDSLGAFNNVMADRHVAAHEALLETIQGADRAVVESYAETARPLTGFEPDAVAVVEPARVRLYDGDRYVKGCAVASGSSRDGRLEERVEAVVDLIEPKATVSLPALTEAERTDPSAVADAYEHAFDGMVAVAVE